MNEDSNHGRVQRQKSWEKPGLRPALGSGWRNLYARACFVVASQTSEVGARRNSVFLVRSRAIVVKSMCCVMHRLEKATAVEAGAGPGSYEAHWAPQGDRPRARTEGTRKSIQIRFQ